MKRSLPSAVCLLSLVFLASANAQELPGLPTQTAEPPASDRQIALDADPAQDARIAERLRGIYGALEGLDSITVDVDSGIVSLGGTVLSGAARDRAVRVARQLEGVVDVQTTRLEEERGLARRLRPALTRLQRGAFDIVEALPLALAGLAIFALFLVAGRLVTHWERPYGWVTRNNFARDLLRQAVRAGFALAGIIVGLEVLEATALVAAVAGAAGLLALALGFAFRDLAENYIASVLLSLRQPFLPKDLVLIEGHEGHVVRLTSRATILMTLAGNHVRIPNSTVFKSVIVNYSRNPMRRFDFTIGVAPDTDITRALRLGIESLRQMPRTPDEPPPQGWVDAIGDSNVLLHFFGWADQRKVEWAKVRGEAIRIVKEAFDAAGVEMPEPVFLVKQKSDAAPARPARTAATTPQLEMDVARDTHIEREVAEDRAATGGDLLDPKAPTE